MTKSEFSARFIERQRQHRRTIWLQIGLPLVLTVLLILVLFGLIVGGGGDITQPTALATIWLILPLLCLGMLVLAILIGGIYALSQTLRGLPPVALRVQLFSWRLEQRLRRVADASTRPVFAWSKMMAMIRAAKQKLFGN